MTEINVLYPFDNNYSQYAGISITSLLENNKTADCINIYVLGFSLDDDNIARLSSTVMRYGRNIRFLSQELIENLIEELQLPAYRGASVAAARLFLPMFVEKEVKRIVYLDSDTIITSDMSELMTIDLNGSPVGMVIDSVGRDYKTILGFSKDDPYYNAGMIVFDIAKWNELDCTQRIIDHIRSVRNNYDALDQDLINIVLKGQIQTINLKYNFQPFHFRYSSDEYIFAYGTDGYYTSEEISRAEHEAVILHCFRFLGMFPWHRDSIHPNREIYEKYKSISNWADCDATDTNKKTGIVTKTEIVLYRILPDKIYLWLFRRVMQVITHLNDSRLKKGKEYRNT